MSSSRSDNVTPSVRSSVRLLLSGYSTVYKPIRPYPWYLMMYLLTSKHCVVKDCQSLMFDFKVWCSTSKFDFEVEVWCCLIFEWKFKVDFENVLCIWRWGLNLKFEADVQCRLLKFTFDVDSESNMWSWHLKLKSEVKFWSWSLRFEVWIWNLKLKLEVEYWL